MKLATRTVVSILISICALSSTGLASGANRAEVRTSILRVTPAFGSAPRNLAVALSPSERRVTARITREIQDLQSFIPQTLRLITWYVEPGSESSATVALARDVLVASQQIFETFNVFDGQATSIVIGRTQRFLNELSLIHI